MALQLLAYRIWLHSRYTPCVNPSYSKIDALSYQLQFVNYALRMLYEQGAVRLLLADDVGLGKTVMTGLLLREMLSRGVAKRVLIVVPKILKFQWRRELREKFDISCSESLNGDCVVVSLDYLKRHIDEFEKIPWDIVVFDEAHNLTVPRGKRMTKRYEAATRLADRVKNILLLTATPHHGDLTDFLYRLRLLSPDVDEVNYLEKIGELVVRRLREDVKDEVNIPDRVSYTVQIELSDEERRFYDKLVEYVRYYYDLAKRRRGRERKALELVAIVFQKRASSSIYAALRTVERRLNALKEIQKGIRKPKITLKAHEAVKYVAPSDADLATEISILEKLLELGQRIHSESKLQHVKKILETHQDSKVIIFTQYRDTLYFLQKELQREYPNVVILHGGMDEEERKKAEREFIGRGRLLIATDAASEGLNLQVANVLINYDLPWNPTRLDQRIGRIHRFGQRRQVYVYNFLISDTIDGKIYEILLRKIENIKRDVGRVFDYLGMVIDEAKFKRLVAAAALQQDVEKKIDEIVRSKAKLKDIEELLEEYRIRLPEDPRCDDYITDEELKMLVLGTLDWLDPMSYSESNGCITVRYIPREISQYCTGQCRVANAGFGVRHECHQSITVEHPLVQAIIRYYLSTLPPKLAATSDKPCYAYGDAWVYEAKAAVELPINLEGATRRFEVYDAGLYYKPKAKVCNEEGKLPTSVLSTLIPSKTLSPETGEMPQEYLKEVKENIRKKLEEICNKIDQWITAEMHSILTKLDKSKTEQARRRKEEVLARGKAIRDQLRRMCQNPEIQIDDLSITIYPHGFEEIKKAEEPIEQGRQGEELVKKLEEADGCHVIDLRDKPTAGVDFLSICRDEIRYIEVKTVKGLGSKIHIPPVEAAKMCSKPNPRYMVTTSPSTVNTYLYVVDLERRMVAKYKNPCERLKPYFEKYKKEQTKYVIPYSEILKLEPDDKISW